MKPHIDRLIGRLAILASMALIIALVITVGRVVAPTWFARLGWASTPLPGAYSVGELIDLPNAVYRSTPFTVVLFARSNCSACDRAKPFDQAVATLLHSSLAARMIVVSPDADRAQVLIYVASIGLDDSALVDWPGAKPRVTVVPTLVLVNNRGVILGAWEGVGTAAEQAQILHQIRATIGSR